MHSCKYTTLKPDFYSASLHIYEYQIELTVLNSCAVELTMYLFTITQEGHQIQRNIKKFPAYYSKVVTIVGFLVTRSKKGNDLCAFLTLSFSFIWMVFKKKLLLF